VNAGQGFEGGLGAAMATIDILLATYTGAAYLRELLVRDDGSTDGTVSIINAWADEREQPVRIIVDGRGGLGACGNFDALLGASDAPYFMLCDQDDVWLPDKVSRLVDLIRSAEAQKGSGVPILGHSDLEVVDHQLGSVHPSFKRYMRIGTPPAGCMRQRLLVYNTVTGCASVGNAALREAAFPIPPEAVMHDWWLALVAAMFGEIAYLPEPTVLYRQHGLNSIGASSWSLPALLYRLLKAPTVHIGKAQSIIRRTQSQAKAFASRYGPSLDVDIREIVETYGALGSMPVWQRKEFVIRNRLWGRNPSYSASLLLLV
jgi:glycosyltransferase involved in cell wall biosynthesis